MNNNTPAHDLAREIIARPANTHAVAAYKRGNSNNTQPGDAYMELALVSAIVGELIARLGNVTLPHTIVHDCLWEATN